MRTQGRTPAAVLTVLISISMVFGLIVVGGAAQAVDADSVGQGFDPDPGLPKPEPSSLDEEAAGKAFLESLAQDFDLTFEEARERMRLQGAAHSLNAWLVESHSGSYAGTQLTFTPPFSIRVGIAHSSLGSVRAEIDEWFEDASSVVLEPVEYSLAELFDAHASVASVVSSSVDLADRGLHSRVDVVSNRVVVTHPDPAVGDAIRTSELRDIVEFDVGSEVPIVDLANYIGGLKTKINFGCTSGFTVVKNGSVESGATTAGHCVATTGIVGISEPFGPLADEAEDSNVDTEWLPLTDRNWTPTNQIKVNDNGNTVRIKGRVPYTSISIGDYLCKYGWRTGSSCGPVVGLACCDPGHQFIEVMAHAYLGDSGAPFYEFVEPLFYAVATVSALGADTIAGSITFWEQRFGVTVATSTPPTPAHDWFLRNSNTQGVSDDEWQFGESGMTAVRGRWTAQAGGDDRPGFFRNGVWDLEGQARFAYGGSSDLPIVGDWDSDDLDEVGYYRQSTSTFYRRYHASIPYGNPGDVPVIGDWDGDGDDEIGVWRPSEARFYLRSDAGATSAHYYGTYTDLPLVGDWDNDGMDEIGVYRPSTQTWYLQGFSGFVYGIPNDIPLPGDWDGDGRDTPGIVR